MPYSYTTYAGDGSTTDFNVTFDYLDPADVSVLVDGDSVDFTWVNESQIRCDSAPANGTEVVVQRVTPKETNAVDYQDGSTLTAVDLDANSKQLLFIIQEAADATSDSTVENLSITTAKIAEGAVTTTKIDDNAVTNTEFRQSAGLSVVGRSANTTGNVADIAAGSDGDVLRRFGTSIGFGALAASAIPDQAVTYAKIQDVSATARLLGRSTAGAGPIEELTVGTGLDLTGGVLSNTVTGVVDAALTDGGTITITATSVNPSKGAGPAVDKVVYRRSGNILQAWYHFANTTSGSAGTGTYLFAIPGSLTVDTTYFPYGLVSSTSSDYTSAIGTGYGGDSGTSALVQLVAILYNSTHFAIRRVNDSANSYVNSSTMSLNGAHTWFSVMIQVPISGW